MTATLIATLLTASGILGKTPPQAEPIETHRIRIENKAGGFITVSRDHGATWAHIGTVTKPMSGKVHLIQDFEFTASDWAPIGSVTAIAVNALHIKAGQKRHAQVFSILPLEMRDLNKKESYKDESATIFTDIKAGTGIFETPLVPVVGAPLFLEEVGSPLIRWPDGKSPKVGETLVIISRSIPSTQSWIEFENKWDGQVKWIHGNGRQTKLARVLRPLGGAGRFGGTDYQEPGQVRANHPGVICVSTSPIGKHGGFQIIPSHHANNPAMHYLYKTTAYMIIGPLKDTDAKLEGQRPLFGNLIKPGFTVQAKIKGEWQSFPEYSGKIETGLNTIEAIRVQIPKHPATS